MNRFISKVDDCPIDYEIVNGNLFFRIGGTDWQDFCPNDKRAYSDEEYAEFIALLQNEET